MLIKSVRGFTPKYGIDCFFAENSSIIGEVIMGDNCSVWYQAVIRGDVNFIEIGNRVNIQDGAIVHPFRLLEDQLWPNMKGNILVMIIILRV